MLFPSLRWRGTHQGPRYCLLSSCQEIRKRWRPDIIDDLPPLSHTYSHTLLAANANLYLESSRNLSISIYLRVISVCRRLPYRSQHVHDSD